MSIITSLLATDKLKDSRAVINTNLANLNADKVETLANLGLTQLAAAYNAVATTPNIPTAGEKAAQAGGGAFGAPSALNKFITETFFTANSSGTDVQEFTANGTWTKPAFGTLAVIDIIGSGGSGGAAKGSTSGRSVLASGGSGGAYRQFIVSLASLAATETVTVGAGGAAVTANVTDSNANGLAGAVSWFKSTAFQANGGNGGASNWTTNPATTAASVGGVRATLFIAEDGGNGGGTNNNPSSAGGGAATLYAGAGGGGAVIDTVGNPATGAGGVSALLGVGGAGIADTTTANITGNAGTRGGGGGGTVKRNATGNLSSGAGGAGFIRVTVF